MSELVKVEKSELEELVRAAAVLNALDGAGVDNWEGYDYAERPSDEEVSELVKGYIKND